MKTEAEATQAGGEFSEIEVKSDVETVREADEEHPGHRTQANEEAGSIVLHAGNDMDEKVMTDSASGAVATKKRSRWHTSEKKQMNQ